MLSLIYIYYCFRLFFNLLLIFAVCISPAGDHYSKTCQFVSFFLVNKCIMYDHYMKYSCTNKRLFIIKNSSLLTVCMKSSYMSWRTNLVLKVGGGILDVKVCSSIFVLLKRGPHPKMLLTNATKSYELFQGKIPFLLHLCPYVRSFS